MSQEVEDEKLIMFSWIVHFLGIPKDANPTEYNKLVDKLYEFMEFRTTEPLQRGLEYKAKVVLWNSENASEAPYEGQEANVELARENVKRNFKDIYNHTIGCTQQPYECSNMCSCECHYGMERT